MTTGGADHHRRRDHDGQRQSRRAAAMAIGGFGAAGGAVATRTFTRRLAWHARARRRRLPDQPCPAAHPTRAGAPDRGRAGSGAAGARLRGVSPVRSGTATSGGTAMVTSTLVPGLRACPRQGTARSPFRRPRQILGGGGRPRLRPGLASTPTRSPARLADQVWHDHDARLRSRRRVVGAIGAAGDAAARHRNGSGRRRDPEVHGRAGLHRRSGLGILTHHRAGPMLDVTCAVSRPTCSRPLSRIARADPTG